MIFFSFFGFVCYPFLFIYESKLIALIVKLKMMLSLDEILIKIIISLLKIIIPLESVIKLVTFSFFSLVN